MDKHERGSSLWGHGYGNYQGPRVLWGEKMILGNEARPWPYWDLKQWRQCTGDYDAPGKFTIRSGSVGLSWPRRRSSDQRLLCTGWIGSSSATENGQGIFFSRGQQLCRSSHSSICCCGRQLTSHLPASAPFWSALGTLRTSQEFRSLPWAIVTGQFSYRLALLLGRGRVLHRCFPYSALSGNLYAENLPVGENYSNAHDQLFW